MKSNLEVDFLQGSGQLGSATAYPRGHSSGSLADKPSSDQDNWTIMSTMGIPNPVGIYHTGTTAHGRYLDVQGTIWNPQTGRGGPLQGEFKQTTESFAFLEVLTAEY